MCSYNYLVFLRGMKATVEFTDEKVMELLDEAALEMKRLDPSVVVHGPAGRVNEGSDESVCESESSESDLEEVCGAKRKFGLVCRVPKVLRREEPKKMFLVDEKGKEMLCKLGKAYAALFDYCTSNEIDFPEEDCLDFDVYSPQYFSVSELVPKLFTEEYDSDEDDSEDDVDEPTQEQTVEKLEQQV